MMHVFLSGTAWDLRTTNRPPYFFTQATIKFHQTISELSTQLFEKLGRRRVLTKAGEEPIPYVDEVLASIKKMGSFEADLSKCREDLHA